MCLTLQSVRLIWLFRTATGLLMFAGVLLFAFNMYMTATRPEPEPSLSLQAEAATA